jgi:hypothetical protein
MSDDVKSPEGHVVAATLPLSDNSVVGPALFAVVADTREQAEEAVRILVSPNAIVEAAGGALTAETIERLALVPGEAKQIG